MFESIAIPTLSPKQFRKLLDDHNRPIVAEFWASWCAPCRHMAQDLQAMAGEFLGRITLVRIDIDAALELAEQHGVGSVPSLLTFMNGQEIARVSGPLRPKPLKEFLVRTCPGADTP
jgi:thioredoxin 1